MDNNCIFCKIAAGEIPSSTVYEDGEFRVIMDISPAAKGHCIILPKEHAANIFELSEETAGKIFAVAKKVATAMKEELGCEGINVLQNNGEAAGQTVFHFHMHIIPRYEGGPKMVSWEPGEPSSEELAELAECIKKELA